MPPHSTTEAADSTPVTIMRKHRLVVQPIDKQDNSVKEPVGFVMVDDDCTLSKLRPQVDALLFNKTSSFGEEKRKYKFYYEAVRKNNSVAMCKISSKLEDAEKAKDFCPVLQVRIEKPVKKPGQVAVETEQGFEVEQEAHVGCNGKTSHSTTIVLRPQQNVQSSQIYTKLKTILRESFMYDPEPHIPLELLFQHLETIARLAQSSPCLQKLVTVIQEGKAAELEKMKNLREDGDITFDFLQHLFPPGTKVSCKRRGVDDQTVGGSVISCRLVRSFFCTYVEVCYKVIRTNGKKFFSTKERACISGFAGAKKISDLPIRPLSDDEEQPLRERGRKFAQYGLGAHYLAYSGNLLKESWCGPTFFKAHGRVMIDAVSYQRNNPNSRISEDAEDGAADSTSIDDDQLFMCWPTLLGFSFSAKKWGEVDLNFVNPIEFDDLAFQRLVLAPEKKQLVQGLVQNYQTSFSDIISGKGGGCIFLLHGQPGTGKTLTAEAIAELLHRPLYSVTVGELGTSTCELEKSLREILEVASAWNAVVLLDEADIFLEKRTENDIMRNAMVGIFLRLLEYHQGVLFLTTNRVKSFDPAFHSRISVALRYPDLGRDERRQVCENLLAAAGMEGLDVDELSAWELNGRQLKTTIRLAQSLALSQGVPVGREHVRQTVTIAQQFKDDLEGEAGDL